MINLEIPSCKKHYGEAIFSLFFSKFIIHLEVKYIFWNNNIFQFKQPKLNTIIKKFINFPVILK